MKFEEMLYQRPDLDQLFLDQKSHLTTMEEAKSSQEFFDALDALDKNKSLIDTQGTLAYVRHTINTKDDFYQKEQDYYDENLPKFNEIDTQLAKITLNSPYREDFAKKFGEHALEKFEVMEKSFIPEVVEEVVEENKLASQYQKLTASAEIEFEGQTYNLAGLAPFMESKDRETRKKANQAHWNWFKENADELDRLFDELVKVRHRIGVKMGYENFIPVAYARMGRTDWTVEDAKVYRDQIAESVVPLTQKLYQEQAKRIGISDMKNYDYNLSFLTGNPTPKGEEAYMVEQAAKMYEELSPETHEFFQVMMKENLMDLTTKPGKANGGYMTQFTDYEVPFIFSNFNGTSGDVDVLTHEAGHAFQGYLNRKVRPGFLSTITSEVAEIHSMSMEFFTHSWMERFFKEDTEKYYYAHLVDSIQFLPYGASIDEFQEWVYQNPTASPADRKAKYREIEKKYLPHIDYDGVEFLENGGRWQKQLHVYLYPFYYLDYTLSQICAHQYFIWSLKDQEAAWNSYLTLAKESGFKPFSKLVPDSGLLNPFKPGTIAKITPELEKYLDSLDHSKIK